MWSLRRSGASSIMSSSDYDSSQGSNLVSSETSTVPSRLDSFSSSNGAVPCNDFIMQTSFDFDDNQVAIPTSPQSSESSHDKHGGKQPGTEVTSTSNSTADQSTSDNAEIAELESIQAERAVSPTIQKWVDESCVETERLKSAGGFSDDVAIKDAEIDEEEEGHPSDFALQQALQYSLRAVSPSFARTASLDAGFSALGDYHSQLTSTESMLLGLGFGGPDLGIPVRFLKSWREQVIKRKIIELQGLLGRSRKSPSPTGSARQYAVKSPRGGESSPRKKMTAAEAVVSSPEKKASQSTNQPVPNPKAAVKPSEKQLQLEKLNDMRRKLRKSATISSFSPSLLPDPNQLFSGKDMKKMGAMSDRKYQKFRGATRGNAKDRRRKFGTRQSSLPISLETLPEEDEGRPAFLQQKSSSFDFVDNRTSSNNTSTATSVNSSKLDVRDEGTELDNVEEGIHQTEGCHKSHPTITVMSEPSEDCSQRFLYIPEIKNKERGNSKAALDGKHLLAIKGIIESKDSGFGNDISNEGTPQLSPEHCPEASKVKNGKNNELDMQDCPQNKGEHAERLHPGENQHTFLSTSFDDRNRVKTEEEEEEKGEGEEEEGKKKSQRVDLCIQVDFPEVFSDGESDVEYSSAGVQTSPWLQSGELSPLCCGHFTLNDLNESVIDSSESTVKHEREINVDLSYQTLSAAGDRQGQEESSHESYSTNQEYGTQDLNPPECPKVVEEKTPSNSCTDVAPGDAKIDSTAKIVSLKEPDFLDGFNSEKRRLSRIEEVTESTLSHQSEEERTKNSFESQHDSVSSQATSTSSSSRPSSSLVLLGTDPLKPSEETSDVNSLKRAQSHSKRVMKQVYKEMLERNIAEDLTNEKDLLLLRTSYQAERCSTKLTVDETLLQAAKKLEMCAKDQDGPESSVDSGDAADVGDGTGFTKGEKQEEPIPSTEIAPTNEPVSQREESLESHLKSIGGSPSDQSGSQQSRRFFAAQSFSSFTDAIREMQSSRSNSNVSDATIDFEGDSFFSVPVDVFDQEPDVNFSLTGSDMNLMSVDEVDHHNPCNPEVTSRIVTIPHEFSLEELDDKYLWENDNKRHMKDFLHGYTRNNYNDMISTISSVESGAFFSETFNDEVSLGKEVFTQSLEINVARLSSEDAVFLSHRSISLSQNGREKSLNRTVPIFQEKQSSTVKVPFKYSSKYYFSVEDYSRYSDRDSEKVINRLDQLSKRRQSLINAHLAARGHVFDEIIDGASLYQTEDRREGNLPSMTAPREGNTTGQEVGDNLTMGSFGEDESVIRDEIAEFMADNERNVRIKKIERYGSGRRHSDKMSGDSDLSLGSSVNSSKVDDYVDLVLDNALQEVRSEELSWNGMKNGKKTHSDPYFGGGNNKSMKQNCSSNFKNGSQFNHRTNMGNGVFDDRSNHMQTTVYTSVERDGMGPESISTLNNKFVSLKEETLGQEKVHLHRTMVNGNSMQSLNNGMSVGEHTEERWLMSNDEICDGSHISSVNCTKKDDITKTKTSTNSPHSLHDSNQEKVDIGNECNRAVVSLGSSETRNVNNGLHCQDIRNKLDLNQKERSLNSEDSRLRALAKSSELMPSYDELYSKAENLISNLDALIAGNK